MKILMLTLIVLGAVAEAAIRNDFLSIAQMTVNGHAFELVSVPETLRVSPNVAQIRWKLRVGSGAKRQGVRIQYRLVGVDDSWKELNGPMSINLRWLDERSSLMDIQSFYPEGQSPGWQTTWETSPFVEHVERVSVPAKGKYFEFQLVSGISAILGTILLDEVNITLEETGEQLYFNSFERSNPVEDGWLPGGLRSEMSRWVSRVENGGTNGMLAIFDNSVIGYSDWRKRMTFSVSKYQGKTMRIAWLQMHDIGSCMTSEIAYDRLASGRYCFEVRGVHPLTKAPVPQTSVSIPFEIPVVLWKQTGFIIICVIGSAFLIGGVVVVLLRTRWRRRLEQSERQRLIEAEKTRIARDLHDDLGAGLTQMGIYSELALQQRNDSEKLSARLEDVFTTAQRLARSLNEIVWAVNPVNDTVESLIAYLGDYVDEYLRVAGIALRSHVPMTRSTRSLASSVRHHLFCCSREILCNMVRHAEATEVLFQIELDDRSLKIVFSDNGKGFDPQQLQTLPGSHNGVNNLRQRMMEAGGSCDIISMPGQGTSVTLKVSL